MRPNLILIAGCALTGGIALALALAWMAAVGQDTIPVPVGIAAAIVSVATSLGVEQTVLLVRRRRARTGPSRHRKPAASRPCAERANGLPSELTPTEGEV